MEPHNSYTRLLGLALRGGNLVTGSDAVQAAIHAEKVRLLLLSADASPRTCRDAQQWSERGHCLCAVLPCDKAELGQALGRGTVAVAALTDTGLANAVGERLARFDPERYAYLSERLQWKVVRAGERRAARARARPDEAKKPVKARSGNVTKPVKARSGEAKKPPNRARTAQKRTRPGDTGTGTRRGTPKQSEKTRSPGTGKGQPSRRPRPKKKDT